MPSSKKIMIVDDDARNIFALSAVLKSRKYEVVTAATGTELFTILEHPENIGIILLDMMLPEIDGYQIMADLRQRNFTNIPVIAVTAQAMMGDREKCLDAGAQDYLPKPVNVDALMLVLKKYLT